MKIKLKERQSKKYKFKNILEEVLNVKNFYDSTKALQIIEEKELHRKFHFLKCNLFGFKGCLK